MTERCPGARTSSSSSLDTTITAVKLDDRRLVDGMRPPRASRAAVLAEALRERADALASLNFLHVATPARCQACSALCSRIQSFQGS